MKISQSPEFFEYIANHKRVFPQVSRHGQGPIVLGSIWHQCMGLEFEGGGWLLHRLAPHFYEVHTLFLPKARNIREKAAEGIRYAFTATECEELVTKVPADLPHALALAKAMGFRERFTRKSVWPRSTGSVDVIYLGLTLDEWLKTDPECLKLGRQFHEALGEHATHSDDPIHDRYVGFAVACGKNRMHKKGVYLYNRWALFAGYQPVALDGVEVAFDATKVSMVNDRIEVRSVSCP